MRCDHHSFRCPFKDPRLLYLAGEDEGGAADEASESSDYRIDDPHGEANGNVDGAESRSGKLRWEKDDRASKPAETANTDLLKGEMELNPQAAAALRQAFDSINGASRGLRIEDLKPAECQNYARVAIGQIQQGDADITSIEFWRNVIRISDSQTPLGTDRIVRAKDYRQPSVEKGANPQYLGEELYLNPAAGTAFKQAFNSIYGAGSGHHLDYLTREQQQSYMRSAMAQQGNRSDQEFWRKVIFKSDFPNQAPR